MHHKVNDFWLLDSKVWNLSLLREAFLESDVHEILIIPLSLTTEPDGIVWNYDKKGIYSVKSGYRIWRSQLAQNILEAPKSWSKLWKIDDPPPPPPPPPPPGPFPTKKKKKKSRHFLWCVCLDCLHTRQALHTKGLPLSVVCSLCGYINEDANHLF